MKHPAFAKEVDLSQPLHPAMEALMQLKYDDEDPTGYYWLHNFIV